MMLAYTSSQAHARQIYIFAKTQANLYIMIHLALDKMYLRNPFKALKHLNINSRAFAFPVYQLHGGKRPLFHFLCNLANR